MASYTVQSVKKAERMVVEHLMTAMLVLSVSIATVIHVLLKHSKISKQVLIGY